KEHTDANGRSIVEGFESFKTKLRPRFIGPFKVVARKGVAYTLNLPKKMRTHPVFFVGLLKPYQDPAQVSEGTLAPTVDGPRTAAGKQVVEPRGAGRQQYAAPKQADQQQVTEPQVTERSAQDAGARQAKHSAQRLNAQVQKTLCEIFSIAPSTFSNVIATADITLEPALNCLPDAAIRYPMKKMQIKWSASVQA
ncbi:putative retrotransposable element Tf2, partial [Phytophthora infestans]